MLEHRDVNKVMNIEIIKYLWITIELILEIKKKAEKNLNI